MAAEGNEESGVETGGRPTPDPRLSLIVLPFVPLVRFQVRTDANKYRTIRHSVTTLSVNRSLFHFPIPLAPVRYSVGLVTEKLHEFTQPFEEI